MVRRRRLASFEVESILERKEVDGVPHYRVRWKNFPPEDDTWEPLEHLQAILPMVQAYEARHSKQTKKHTGIRKGPREGDAVPPPATHPAPPVVEPASTVPQGSLDIDEVNKLVNMWKQGDRVFVCEVEYKNRRHGQAVRNSQERLDVLRYRCPQLVIDLVMSLITVDTSSNR